MKKFIFSLLILFSYTLCANTTIVSEKKEVSLQKPFLVKASQDLFEAPSTYTSNLPLRCQPKLEAIYKIESPNQLKIIPSKTLAPDTTYRCRYKDISFSLKTEPFALLDYHYFPATKVVLLYFNTAPSSQSLTKYLTLQKEKKLSKTTLHYTIQEQKGGKILLKITEPVDGALSALIDSKLSTKSGKRLKKRLSLSLSQPTPLTKLSKKLTPMEIVDAPQFIANTDGSFSLRLFLNEELEGDIRPFITFEKIHSFRIGQSRYISYQERQKWKLQNSYNYIDIQSDAFKPNTTYTLTLRKGLKSYYTQLKQPKHFRLKTPNRAKTIFFEDDKPYLSSKGELGFKSINIDKATLIIERVFEENYRYFVTLNQANTDKTAHFTKVVLTKDLLLNNPKNKIVKQKFKLKDLTKQTLPYGIYKITLRYEGDKKENQNSEKSSAKILFLSDIGISAKVAKEEVFVSLLSLSQTKPIANAQVSLYSANNLLLGKTTTNEQGVAIIRKNDLLRENPKALIVSTKKDKNFLLLDKSIGKITFDEILKKKKRYKAHIYFQSDIVRPEATIHALITLKDRHLHSADSLPLKVILKELYGKRIYQQSMHTTKEGAIDFRYKLDPSDRSGEYLLIVKMGEEVLAQKKLKVEAFLPPKIETKITTDKECYLTNSFVYVKLFSRYLFGPAASNLQGTLLFQARSKAYQSTKFPDFNFTNGLLQEQNSQLYIDNYQEISLDENATATLLLPTTPLQKAPSILEGIIVATLLDDGQNVSASKKITIYPYPVLVGLKLDKSLLEKEKKIAISTIALDPLKQRPIDRELYGTLYKVIWHYAYKEGNYEWEKELQKIESFALHSAQTYTKKVDESGEYILKVSDLLDGHSATATFSMWEWDYSTLSPSQDLASVEILFENRAYQPHETLFATIKSPIIEGYALISLESDKVLWYTTIPLKKGVAKVEVPLTKLPQQGAYLHVSTIRKSDTASPILPFRAYGTKFVKADQSQHKIAVSIDAPETIRSKERFSLTLHTDQEAMVLVSIVDAAILNLTSQKAPHLFDYFTSPPKKQIANFDLYNQLMAYLSSGKVIDFGAGDLLSEEALIQKHLPPDMTRRIKPFMLWSKLIPTTNKKATLSFALPQFNGKAIITAIALNPTSVGSNSKELLVKEDIIIKPSFPRYLLLGDRIQVPIRLFNTTDKTQKITLSAYLPEHIDLTFKHNRLTLEPHNNALIYATLSATKKEEANITLEAQYANNLTTTHTTTLPIETPYTLSTKTFKGIAQKGITSLTIPTPYQDANTIVALSNNFLTLLEDDLSYLIHYPYGCAEQISSQTGALFYALPFWQKSQREEESRHFIQQGVKRLSNMQKESGEFGYWDKESDVQKEASLYVAQRLLELHKAGFALYDEVRLNIYEMLENVLYNRGYLERVYNAKERLYAAYILASHQKLPLSSANMLFEQKQYQTDPLSMGYMAAILALHDQKQEAKKLFEKATHLLNKSGTKTPHTLLAEIESPTATALKFMLLKFNHFSKEKRDFKKLKALLPSLKSTYEKALALQALSTYLGKPKNLTSHATLVLNNQKHTITQPTLLRPKLHAKQIQIAVQKGALIYNIQLFKPLAKAIKNSLSAKKLSIKESFLDEKGKRADLNHLHVNQKLYSKIVLQNRGKIDHVIVVKRLPSCMEIVNLNLSNITQPTKFQNQNANLTYSDRRDDRILYALNLEQKRDKKKRVVPNKSILFTELIVTHSGKCALPATIVEAMYNTDLKDYTKVRDFIYVK